MKSLSKIFNMIVTVILLVGVGSAGYFALRFISSRFGRMDPEVAAVTAIASLVMLLASFIIAGSIRRTSSGSKQNQLRAEKAATYKVVINVWEEHLLSGAVDRATRAASEELDALDRLLILYGSPEVIRAHARLRALAHEKASKDTNMSLQFTRMLMEMRKDIGSETLGFSAGELQQFLLPHSNDAMVSSRTDVNRGVQPRVTLVPVCEEISLRV
jgi:hypothetical protein